MNRNNLRRPFLLQIIPFLFLSIVIVAQQSPYDKSENGNLLRQVDDNTVRAYQNDKKFEYANNPDYWIKTAPEEKVDDLEVFPFELPGTAWQVIAVIMVIALIWLIISRGFITKKSWEKKTASVEHAHRDLTVQVLNQRINEAVADSDYRLAIRFSYLKTLRMLSDRAIVSAISTRTDIDVLKELMDTRYHQDFHNLQKIYQYSWYRGMQLSKAQYLRVATGFDQFNSGI